MGPRLWVISMTELAELEAEIEIGERRWHEVEQEQHRLRETLLRMSGAIQILRELLDDQASSSETERDRIPASFNGLDERAQHHQVSPSEPRS